MRVRVLLDGGEWRAVEAIGFYGPYAIHESVNEENEWSITHVASGKRVWRTRSLSDAVRASRWLDENVKMPLTAKEAEEFVASLPLSAKTEMFYRLEMVAPRPKKTA